MCQQNCERFAEFAGDGGRTVILPDIDWVEISGGEFQYGDESKQSATPRLLTLPTFHISRYPVTYAQFQTFLDDPEGFANSQWFAGLTASDDDRRMREQTFKYGNHPRETAPKDGPREAPLRKTARAKPRSPSHDPPRRTRGTLV